MNLGSKLKRERLQWTESNCSAPKQAKSERSTKKLTGSVFGMKKGFYGTISLKKLKQLTSNIIVIFWIN